MAYNITRDQSDHQYPRGGVPVDFPEATTYVSPHEMQLQQAMLEVSGMNKPVTVSRPACSLFRLAFLKRVVSRDNSCWWSVYTHKQRPGTHDHVPLMCQAGYPGQQSRDIEAGRINSTLVYNNAGAPHAVRLLPNHISKIW